MSDHEFWNELGNLYFMSGAYEPAIHAYARSIELDRKFGRSYSNLALAFVHTGKYTEAIELYLRSIELLPDVKEKAITWNRLGILYRQIKDYQAALAAYRQADILAPQQGDGVEVEASCETKLPLTVSMPSIDLKSILTEGNSMQEIMEDDLLEDVNTELELAESMVDVQWLIGDFVPPDPEVEIEVEYAATKDLSEETLSEPSTSDHGEWKPAYAEDLASIEAPAVVLDDVDVILPVDLQNEMDNEDAQDDVLVAEVQFKVIEDDEETEFTQRDFTFENSGTMEKINAVTVDVTEPEAVQYSQMEYPLTELSPAEINIAKIKRATQANPRNATGWEMLGDAYKSAGMYKDALLAFQTAISINSTKPSLYYRLGLIYAAERREAEAIIAFQKVLELDPKHSLAHASLGSHYLKMGLDELAQRHIDLALNTEFEDENEYNHACLEAICGNNDRALELLQVALQSKQTCITWAQKDPDFDSLRDDPRFTTLLSAYATSR